MSEVSQTGPKMSGLQKTALTVSIIATLLCPLWFAAGALGVRFGILDVGTGLAKMSFQWGPYLLIGAIAVGVVASIIQLLEAPRKGALLTIILTILPLLMLGRVFSIGQMTKALPPIHDIQTDWQQPIVFPANLQKMREDNNWNPVFEDPLVGEAAQGIWPDFVGRSNRELQAQFYQDIRPVILQADRDVALAVAELVAMRQGWKIESVDEVQGVIHATHTSRWYGFTDDIIIRVLPQGVAGARVDVRSVSRVGLSDMGQNAGRIKSFIDDLILAQQG